MSRAAGHFAYVHPTGRGLYSGSKPENSYTLAGDVMIELPGLVALDTNASVGRELTLAELATL